MSRVHITLPDRLKALAESRAAQSGCRSVDDYIGGLIEADEAVSIDADLEADLLKGLGSSARQFTAADWESKRRRLRESFNLSEQ